ncbi:MAG: menaquinone biosynthesis protein [Saprospiraceae bacterium]|nr:menaquinone biosynthesis protein [Saprospiraceae bacterium]
MSKIQITAVSYLNTKPLLYGLFKSDIAKDIDLQLDIPSECARKLQQGEVDLGLVPVATIPEIPNAEIISDYCIGTEGAVKTVGIFSRQPLSKLTKIYLDFHSRTSVELAKILVRQHWQLNPTFIHATEGYIDDIQGSTGGVIIGDRTMGLHEQFPYFYDLGKAWMDFTGLPFVFAAWVSRRPLPKDFVDRFNQALRMGIDAIPELTYILPQPGSGFDLKEYFTQYISYELDTSKKEALKLFLQHLKAQKETGSSAYSLLG